MTSLERSFAPSNNSAQYQASACLEDTLTRPVTSEVEAQYWSIFVDPSARFNGAWLHRPRFVRTQSVGMSPSTYAEDSDGNQLSWRTTPIRNVTSASVDVSTGGAALSEMLLRRCRSARSRSRAAQLRPLLRAVFGVSSRQFFDLLDVTADTRDSLYVN